MPDQSSAADEHAILQEITAPLATLPDDAVPIAADADFPVVLRGYDRVAVDAYVKKTSQLVAELQATRSPEAAVRRALERVGEQISGILQRAHDTRRTDHHPVAPRGRGPARGGPPGGGPDHRVLGRERGQGARRRHRPDLGRAPADRRRRAGRWRVSCRRWPRRRRRGSRRPRRPLRPPAPADRRPRQAVAGEPLETRARAARTRPSRRRARPRPPAGAAARRRGRDAESSRRDEARD